MRVLPIAASALLLVTACASSGTDGTRSSSDVITRDEILDSTARTAFEAVRRLRPMWLNARGPASLDGSVESAVAYVDGMRYGETGRLREVLTADVASIRFLDSRDATTRFGTGHSGGAILVETVR